jgi:hypothetical protein
MTLEALSALSQVGFDRGFCLHPFQELPLVLAFREMKMMLPVLHQYWAVVQC